MIGDLYKIPAELGQRPNFFGDLDVSMFRKLGKISAESILQTPNITLYALDLENQQAVFVKTPPTVNLSKAPFYNIAQFENASQLITISFDTLIQLGEKVSVDEDHIVLIYSVGRCGSTLASQIFAQIPGVINMSEPIALTNLVVARNAKMLDESDLLALLNATIRLLCKSKAEKAWVIKGRSFDIELGDWIHQLFPRTKNLFLYRHAESWLQSCLRAFERDDELVDDDKAARDRNRRVFMNALVPEIAQIEREIPLSHVDMLSLMWLTTMSRYIEWTNMGIKMLAIEYANWLTFPQRTAEFMLDFGKCKPSYMSDVDVVLGRDAQAGTRLARTALEQNKREITKLDLEKLNGHLKNHPFIHRSDFEVPNTLKLDI